MKLSILSGVVLTILLSGCVSLKERPSARIPSSSSTVSENLPADYEKYSTTGIKDSYFGVSGASGSLALGVLFPVLGTLANSSYVKAENTKKASHLEKLTSQDLKKVLINEIKESVTSTGTDYELTPSASLYFFNKSDYFLSCTIKASQKASLWQARYTVAVEGRFDSLNEHDTDSAINVMPSCFKSAYALFSEHVDGKLGGFEIKTVKLLRVDGTGDVSEKYFVATSALPGRIIILDTLGLVQLRKDQIKEVN